MPSYHTRPSRVLYSIIILTKYDGAVDEDHKGHGGEDRRGCDAYGVRLRRGVEREESSTYTVPDKDKTHTNKNTYTCTGEERATKHK